ncbi:hypothetical protein lerEdw1_001303 [Lerista edwardsae]|nr:hypothetical protein lerEdw1_001303 [Lerista edwardsae]
MDNAALKHFPRGASGTEVQKIKNFLGKFWNADICAKEYAYLKGIVLFNPGLGGLKNHVYVQTLQLEAQHTLMDFISMVHRKHRWRYTWIMEMLAVLRNFDTETVRDLFFRPILGCVDFNGLLLAMLYSK